MTTNYSRKSKGFRKLSWHRMLRCGWSVSTTIKSMNLFLSTSKGQTISRVRTPFSGQSISSGTTRRTSEILKTTTRMSPTRARVRVPLCYQSPDHSEMLTMEGMQGGNQVAKPKEAQAYARQPLIQSWGRLKKGPHRTIKWFLSSGSKESDGKGNQGNLFPL